jgi:hypothetical protein
MCYRAHWLDACRMRDRPRVIPVWGKQFSRIKVESTERETLVSGILLELVLYIESIQQN